MRGRVILAGLFTAAQTALVLLMTGASIAKIAMDGWLVFVQHYTNWSWLMQTTFYALTLPAPLIVALGITDSRLSAQAGVVALFFVPLWGIVSAVLLLVIIMLLTGAEFLKSFAQQVPIAVIVVGNEVFHFFTVLLLFAWAVASQRLVYWSLNQLFAQRVVHQRPLIYWSLVAYQMLIGSAITLLVYTAIFDPQVVYETDLNVALGALFGVVSVLFATSPLLVFLCCCDLGDEPLEARWLRESEFEARDERVDVDYSAPGYVFDPTPVARRRARDAE